MEADTAEQQQPKILLKDLKEKGKRPLEVFNRFENLLGETMKLYFQNWRQAYSESFQQFINSADDTVNVTSQIRQIILGYDEYRGQVEMQNHVQHLKKFFDIVQQEGLILSKTKINMGVTQINFLGLEIGNGKVQLQPHIIQKILTFPNPDLETLKGLQQFLGILNYARNYRS